MPTIFYYSLFTALTSFGAGVCCLCQIWKNNILTPARSFFWHYAMAFLFWGFSQSLSILVNSGAQISHSFFIALQIISLLATIIAYILFVRGTTSLFLKDRLIVKLLTTFYGSAVAAFYIYSVLMTDIKSITITTVVFWNLFLPVNLLLGCASLFLFIRGIPFDTAKKKPSTAILSFAWFYIFILNLILWFSLVNYAQDFHLLKLAASKTWFIARAIGHLLLLTGFIFYCQHLRHLKSPEYRKFVEKRVKQQ